MSEREKRERGWEKNGEGERRRNWTIRRRNFVQYVPRDFRCVDSDLPHPDSRSQGRAQGEHDRRPGASCPIPQSPCG